MAYVKKNKPISYLGNKELLKHIHESKLSYSSLINPAYQDPRLAYPDRVVRSIQDVTEPDKVYRVMDNSHIPPGVKPSFAPYRHYLLIDNHPIEVLRSHWTGGANDGQFKDHHGRITQGLAERMMKLVSNFAKKGNWRNYSYNEEMQGQALVQLCQVALQFDESRSAVPNPFAYYTAIANNSFRKILNQEKKMQNLRDDILEDEGQMPSHSRQTENEAQQRGEVKPKLIFRPGGRTKKKPQPQQEAQS